MSQKREEGQSPADDIEGQALGIYREIAAHLPGYVSLVDEDRRFLWVNRVAAGLRREDVIGRRVDDFTAAPYVAATVEAVAHVFATGEERTYEAEGYGEGGQPFWYRTLCTRGPLHEGKPTVVQITRDVTREKLAELELRASEARFRAFLLSLPDYVLELDAERRVTFTNRFRPTSRDVLGSRLEDLVEPTLRDEVRHKLERLFATGNEVSWSTAEGADEAYVVRAVLLPGDPPRALVITTDATRVSLIRERLRESEERLERAVRGARVGLWELDTEAGVGTLSEWFREHVGLPSSIVPRADWLAMIHPDDLEETTRALADHLAGRTPIYEREYRMRHHVSGDWIWIRVRARRITHADGRTLVAGTATDVTQQRAAEERQRTLERHLEHAQRLESIGLLAGGVAHDFNNLLTVISSGVELAEMALANGKSAAEDLSEVALAARRAAELTRRLLAFGQRSPLRIEPIDVRELVRDVSTMVRRVLPETIAIETDPSEGSEPIVVRGDRGQLEQVLLNLCVNARDAMPEGGRLVLAVVASAEHVELRVGDVGTGIPPEDIARIFEPFFSTKPAHRGSGLGLAVVHGIVQQHQGRVRVESQVGRGTTMRVRLPRHHEAIGEASREVPARAPRGGDELVLIAEDEAPVRSSTRRVLEANGYRVLEAADGAEAVEHFVAGAGSIDMVLLDAVMPRLDGRGAYERIRAIDPLVPVLFCSGYAASVLASHDSSDAPPLLAKPFRSEALLRAVREAIDAARAVRARVAG